MPYGEIGRTHTDTHTQARARTHAQAQARSHTHRHEGTDAKVVMGNNFITNKPFCFID